MTPLAIAIAKCVIAVAVTLFAIWLLRYDAWRAGYAQRVLDERLGVKPEQDEHAGGIPQ